MSLTPEQKQAVAAWVAAGANLSAVQKKLAEEFKISLTYRDVRFLVDDLDLAIKDAAPKIDASDVTKTQPPAAPTRQTASPGGATAAGPGEEEIVDDVGAEELTEDELAEAPAGDSNVSVTVDQVTLIPGALASGTVTFSDGVTGKWVVDQYGRPGFTDVSKPGYRPSPGDGQAFMTQLSRALQQRGF
jgi:hypothetical protein